MKCRYLSTAFIMVFVCSSACTAPRTGRPVEPAVRTSPRAESHIRFSLRATGLPDRGNWKCDPVIADVNGDGIPDLAVHERLGHGPHVWLGQNDGSWKEASSGLQGQFRSCGGGLAIEDVNRDGHVDMVVADHCQGLFVFLGDGQGHWKMVTERLYPVDLVLREQDRAEFVGAEDVTLGDVNNDGHWDLLAGSSDNGGINLYLGDGTGVNWTRVPCDLPTSSWTNRVQLADVNGDGRLDVVASYSKGPRMWLGDGRGGFSSASVGLPTPLIQGLYTGLAVGDVNEDGRVDIATANWVDGPEVYLQQEDQTWKKTPDVFPGMLGGAYGLAMGDMDRDGHLDLIVSGRLTRDVGYVYGVFLLCGNGKGEWTYEANTNLPNEGLSFTFGVATGDVNNDDILEIAIASGGIVATDPNQSKPFLPSRIQVWSPRLMVPVSQASSPVRIRQ